MVGNTQEQANQFVQMLMTLQQTPDSDITCIVEGKVVVGDPENPQVEITVNTPEGPQKAILDKKYIILSPFCIETWIPKMWYDEQTHTHEYHHGTTSAEIGQIRRIRRWRGLREGDIVLMLKLNRGQQYYVLHRKEGVIDN